MAVVSSLDDAIKLLEGNPEKPIDWKNSALTCLKNRDFPLRTVDVLNCMFADTPEKLSDFIKRRNYISALSIALNNLCDKGILERIPVPGFKGYFYGSKHLFTTSGALLPSVNARLMYELWENKDGIFQLAEKAHQANPDIYEGDDD